MKITTIIVAGGSGSRMGTETPKQFLLLGGLPVLMRTIMAVRQAVDNYVNNFVIVIPSTQVSCWRELCAEYNFDVEHQVAIGGSSRFESVKSGLSLVQDVDLVLIHDGVRPFVDGGMVERTIEAALENGAAIPVTEITDSLREIVDNLLAMSSKVVDRANFRAVQTPQVFRKELIAEAYKQPFDPSFTDDASVVEHLGHAVALTEGDPRNIKITTLTDLQLATIMLTDNV